MPTLVRQSHPAPRIHSGKRLWWLETKRVLNCSVAETLRSPFVTLSLSDGFRVLPRAFVPASAEELMVRDDDAGCIANVVAEEIVEVS